MIRLFKPNKKHKEIIRLQNSNAQLLLLGGITVSIAIITLSVISVSLSSISTPLDKSTFIKSDYDNIRKEFGVALQDRLGDKLDYNEDLIRAYFNDTRDIFVFFVESVEGNNFDAKYLGRTYSANNVVDGMRVQLTLGNGYDYLSEEFEYDLK